ncbi:MAG TPA: GNAT family N-acetyltransferase [Actinomycetaceae bacterium]|nr:GNAT family N-acetyltransferase [Actinomycetaceae bacterium]
MTLRALTEADARILSEATLLNLNWSEPRFSEDDVHSNPHFRHYTELVPARGDFGYLLEDETGWVSVVWLLFLDHQDPGYGYVDDGIPELSICTTPMGRGQGHGLHIMHRAIEEARTRRLGSISLSVEAGNPARRLYEQLGFQPVPDALNEGTMVLVID